MNTAMVFGSTFTPRLAAPQHARCCRQSARAMRMVRAEAATASKDLGFKTMRAGIKEVRLCAEKPATMFYRPQPAGRFCSQCRASA